MEIKSLDELIKNIHDEAVIDTVNYIGDLYTDSCDIVMDLLEEEGMTLSEKSLITHVLELQSCILSDLIEDELEIDEYDEDCENCPLAEEE